MKDVDLLALQVSAHMPSASDPFGGDAVPQLLVGSTIVGFGAPIPCDNLEGGGLIIDCIPAGESKIVRIVLEFTELGMWVRSILQGQGEGTEFAGEAHR
jgi:hypothetical protein